MPYQPGTHVGDYEVLDLAGLGGMGEVYRVRNVLTDRIDAMKVVAAAVVGPDSAERFLREIRVQARLRHPNIASLYTAFRHEDRVAMVMEWVEGPTVAARLAGGPIDAAGAVSVATQVLAALSYAHGAGVVHRDIKPANISFAGAGTVKLLDFGIAREAGDHTLTAQGAAIGSLHYMSPEQVRAQPLDGRSDIYSLGLTLYEMVTGRGAIPGENPWEIMAAQIQLTPPAPADANPAVPRALSDAIARSIAKNPSDRFASAAEFAAALGAHSQATTSPAPPVGPATLPGLAGFPADALAALEGALTPHVGPIARHLVRKAAARQPTLPEVCRALAAEVPTDAERRAFLAACARALGPETVTDTGSRQAAPSAAAASPRWDPAVLERARTQLAAHIGPFARVIVERAARTAGSVEELYATISSEIPQGDGRERFLAGRPTGGTS